MSAELLVRMSHNIDFKDKLLKILGSAAKVSAIGGSPHEKDLRSFASQLSAARRWMKFMKILRSTTDILNPAADIASFSFKRARFPDYMQLVLNKMEFVADIAQMVAEDVNTLHKAQIWTSALGMKPIANLGVIEERAWWVWSLLAALNSFVEMKRVGREYLAASLRLEALNPETASGEIASMNSQVAGLRIKYYLVVFKFVKFACEVVDSSITLTPAHLKKINPAAFELVSCFAGSLSAASSLHKLFYSESKAIRGV